METNEMPAELHGLLAEATKAARKPKEDAVVQIQGCKIKRMIEEAQVMLCDRIIAAVSKEREEAKLRFSHCQLEIQLLQRRLEENVRRDTVSVESGSAGQDNLEDSVPEVPYGDG